MSPDQNENAKGSSAAVNTDMDPEDDYDAGTDAAEADADSDTATNAKNCSLGHGVGAIVNMRRFGKAIQFEVECDVCDQMEWQPVNTVKKNHPQKVIDFYESCIEWKSQ